jgi:hypothetical protein
VKVLASIATIALGVVLLPLPGPGSVFIAIGVNGLRQARSDKSPRRRLVVEVKSKL